MSRGGCSDQGGGTCGDADCCSSFPFFPFPALNPNHFPTALVVGDDEGQAGVGSVNAWFPFLSPPVSSFVFVACVGGVGRCAGEGVQGGTRGSLGVVWCTGMGVCVGWYWGCGRVDADDGGGAGG